jgi:hypothetical protein
MPTRRSPPPRCFQTEERKRGVNNTAAQRSWLANYIHKTAALVVLHYNSLAIFKETGLVKSLEASWKTTTSYF